MSFSKWMDKKDVVFIHSGVLFSNVKEENNAICSNMDAIRDYHTKWSKPEKERQIPYDITYMCNLKYGAVQFSAVQSLSHVWLFATPWIAARQASLSITNSRSLPKLMSIKSVMPSSHLILCRTLLLLPSIPPSIRVFSNESTLCMRWPKDWSFSFSISMAQMNLKKETDS